MPFSFSYIQEKCFQYYPLVGKEKLEEQWDACIVAIDSKNRGLSRLKENNKNASN